MKEKDSNEVASYMDSEVLRLSVYARERMKGSDESWVQAVQEASGYAQSLTREQMVKCEKFMKTLGETPDDFFDLLDKSCAKRHIDEELRLALRKHYQGIFDWDK